ncbi:MAG: M48 family metallopeptidase [bacterium]
MYSITINNRTIKYDIIRTKRKKTIGIQIDPDNGVLIRSPKRVSDQEIEEIVKNKADWIFRKLEDLAQIKPAPAAKDFVNGDKVLYLGRKYELSIIEDNNLKYFSLRLVNDKIRVFINSDLAEENRREIIRSFLISWYQEQAERVIKARVSKYQLQIGKKPNNIRVKNQKKRWGSCSSKGNLNFNWKIIMAPLEIIDYLVVHELVHLVHPNHSKKFRDKLASIIPEYKEREEWLRVNQRLLII